MSSDSATVGIGFGAGTCWPIFHRELVTWCPFTMRESPVRVVPDWRSRTAGVTCELSKIRSWIVTTAKFKTWATVRGSKGMYSPETDEEMEREMANIADTAPLADQTLIELEQQHLIRTALILLEERCQKIISMLYLRSSAASYSEVAGEVGVGETRISPLRSRWLKKLEKLLAK